MAEKLPLLLQTLLAKQKGTVGDWCWSPGSVLFEWAGRMVYVLGQVSASGRMAGPCADWEAAYK